MADIAGLFLPSPEERALNRWLRAEHLEHLRGDPAWAPGALARWPRAVVRFHNRLVPRLPMTAPLGWLDGITWADEQERGRIGGLPADEQAAARMLHTRAVHFRCVRTTPLPTDETPSGDETPPGDEAD